MSQKLFITMCALIFGVVCVGLWNSKPSIEEAPPESERVEIQNFSFNSLDGRSHSLHDFKGKIIFINGWFTRCPPCIREMPEFLELAHKHPHDMVFIAISVDNNKEDIESYLSRLPEKTRILAQQKNVFFVHDKDKLITRKVLGIRGFPETIISDREARKMYHIRGVVDWLGPKVESIFSQHPAQTE